jgi:hypothetical protein
MITFVWMISLVISLILEIYSFILHIADPVWYMP